MASNSTIHLPGEIKPGQIWRENDKRFTRFVKIIRVTPHMIFFRTWDDEVGAFKFGTRESSALRNRFGKGGGYVFVREAA